MSVAYGGWLDRKYRRALEAIPQNLVATVLAVAVAAPVFGTCTDLPTRPKVSPSTQRTVTQNLVATVLLGQDSIYGDPGQAPTTVFPNPPRAPLRQLRTEQGPNLQGLLQTPAEEVPPGAVRVELPPRGPTRLRADTVQNLSLTTLIGQGALYGEPGQAPTVIFPNPPLGPKRNPQYEQGPNLQALLQTPPEALPPGTATLALPPRGPTRLRADLTQNLVTTTLVAQDALYGAPGQAPTIIFPNPPRGRPAGLITNRTWISRNAQAALGVGARRAIVTWLEFEVPDAMPDASPSPGLPPRRTPRLTPSGAQNPSPALLTSQSLPPGQRLLALPPAGRRATQPDQPRNLQILLGVVESPPGTVALALPPARVRQGNPAEQPRNLQPLLGALPPGIVSVELPPRSVRRLPLGFTVAFARVLLGQDTFYGAPGQAPTIFFPRPPRGYPPGPVANRTLLLRGVRMIGQDTIYGAPGQVPTRIPPNPRGYPPGPLANRTQVGSLVRLIGLSIVVPTEPSLPFVPGTIDPTHSATQPGATDETRTSTAPGNPSARSSTTGGSL